ncbi:MAG: hypothetical protein ACYSWR_00465 [Planctomycetota bacterium]|jgi:hypothetical protein
MNKTRILIVAVIVLGAAGVGLAEEGKLGVTLDVTYASRWLSDGAEVYSEDGAFHETISLDFYGTGFGAAVTHSSATDGGWVDKQRLDYKVFYSNSLFDDHAYKTCYNLKWIYKNYYDRARDKGNIQEWRFGFSWPKLLDNGLVPKYTLVYCYPAGSSYDNYKISGFLHVFGLGYSLNVPQLPNPVSLSANVTFRDGAGCTTASPKDHDWSHATLGASTKLKIADNLTFVPGVYHQISMDDSVNTRDVTYVKLSMKYKF